MPDSPDTHLPLKPVVFEILVALAREAGHGYGILKSVREHSEGRVRLETGPLYRHLRRLLRDGLVAEVDPPSGEDSDDTRRRYYAVTGLGRQVLAAEGERLAAAVDRARALRIISG
ncbi:MAG: PadR family transcriptional regulator [Gemmatimonadetes bacterium]|nr:PadR family transcriptional regulator [Gemmatimonadota bacterium]